MELSEKIKALKERKNAVILAHYYQRPEIQQVANYVGDSLELSMKAAATDADIIVFCGVHFMAETAKIVNPNKKVLLPEPNAGCSLADSCSGQDFMDFIAAHPDHVVVTYINASAGVKAVSDYVCTSSNAVKVVNSIPRDRPVIFAPDKNLGRYVMTKTNRNLLLWDGSCIVHEAFSADKIIALHKKYPNAEFIAHPEAEPHILKIATFIGSTSQLLAYVKKNPKGTFIVGTEAGILNKMAEAAPEATLLPAPTMVSNDCSCSECAFMKMNTLEKLYQCLKDEIPEIHIDASLARKAYEPVSRMMQLS